MYSCFLSETERNTNESKTPQEAGYKNSIGNFSIKSHRIQRDKKQK